MRITAPGLPPSYLAALEPLVQRAKGFLEEGETLASVAFVGNYTTRLLTPILLNNQSDDTKEASASTIRMTAHAIDADFVICIHEAWCLGEKDAPRYDEIIRKYGSIGNSPYKQDVAYFSIETRFGTWVGQQLIKAKGLSKKRRTIGDVTLEKAEWEGRFTSLLPAKPDMGTTLNS